MSFWDFNRLLTRRLMSWAWTSAALGLLMSVFGRFWAGVGSQFIGWAVINGAIAWFGGRGTEKRLAALGKDANKAAVQTEEAAKLRRLLWINFGLDVLYMWGGWKLLTRRRASSRTRGIGLGIILQGLFLFIFDGVHAQQVPEKFTTRRGKKA
jgi:hypothetical protein